MFKLNDFVQLFNFQIISVNILSITFNMFRKVNANPENVQMQQEKARSRSFKNKNEWIFIMYYLLIY